MLFISCERVLKIKPYTHSENADAWAVCSCFNCVFHVLLFVLSNRYESGHWCKSLVLLLFVVCFFFFFFVALFFRHFHTKTRTKRQPDECWWVAHKHRVCGILSVQRTRRHMKLNGRRIFCSSFTGLCSRSCSHRSRSSHSCFGILNQPYNILSTFWIPRLGLVFAVSIPHLPRSSMLLFCIFSTKKIGRDNYRFRWICYCWTLLRLLMACLWKLINKFQTYNFSGHR